MAQPRRSPGKSFLQDPISDEDLQLAEANAMRQMRDEFKDHYSRLGPDHTETMALGNWLAENDTDWYAAFLKSESEKRAHMEKSAQEDDIGREVHDRFVRVPESPIFDEPTTKHLLGKLAFRMWRSPDQELQVWSREQIEAELQLGADLDSFLKIAEGMEVLSQVEEGAFRFAERWLVNYFAVPSPIRYLESEYSDRGFLRDRAVKALEKIGARRGARPCGGTWPRGRRGEPGRCGRPPKHRGTRCHPRCCSPSIQERKGTSIRRRGALVAAECKRRLAAVAQGLSR